MPGIHFRNGGAWATGVDTVWVRSNGAWTRPARSWVRSNGAWVVGDTFPPAAPVLSLETPVSSTPTTVRIIAALPSEGGPPQTVVFRRYRYNSAGSVASKTLDGTSTMGVSVGAPSVVLQETGLSQSTKYSWEAEAISAVGESSSTSNEFKVQTGAAAVIVFDVPIYGWGGLGDWAWPQNSGLNVTANYAAADGFPVSNISDTSGGDSTIYVSQQNFGTTTYSNWFGQSISPPEVTGVAPGTSPRINLNVAGGGTKVRVDEIRFTYQGRIGRPSPNPFGIILRGRSLLDLFRSSGGTVAGSSLTALCAGDHGGALSLNYSTQFWGISSSGSTLKSALNQVIDPGQYLAVRMLIPPVWFGIDAAKATASSLLVRVRRWVITSYGPRTVSAAVATTTW